MAESSEGRELTRILLVDDDEKVRDVLARVLRRSGYEVEEAEDGESAAHKLANAEFETVVTDIAMPKVDGLSLLKTIRERNMDLPVILVTGETANNKIVTEAIRYGAMSYIPKPVDVAELVTEVQRAITLYKVAKLRREALELAGSSALQFGDRAGLEVRFDRALAGLFMHYQPIVSWSGRSIIAFEALMRSREATLPHPGVLLEAAERLGRVEDLGRRVRLISSEPLSRAPAGALLFVNLHTKDLTDEALYDPQSTLSRVAKRVVLEITERARLEQVDNVRTRIARLREIGYRIAIDDIGAGYAGLTSFAILEPDFVKLDMTLIRNVDQSRIKQKLIASFSSLCKELEIELIAEGVETDEEKETLVELGCDLFQGYLFARPGEPFVEPRF